MTVIPEKPVQPVNKPTIDEIVVAYLAKVHDIHVQPISSVSPSRATNALMTAVGGTAVMAVNAHLTHQQKAAAQQEWLHMKTFAMQQPDFPEFKDRVMQRYIDAMRKYEIELNRYNLEMQQPEVIKALQAKQDAAKKTATHVAVFFVGLIALGAVAANVNTYLLQPAAQTQQR